MHSKEAAIHELRGAINYAALGLCSIRDLRVNATLSSMIRRGRFTLWWWKMTSPLELLVDI